MPDTPALESPSPLGADVVQPLVTVAITQWALMSPALLAKQFEAAKGATFTNAHHSLSSPQLMGKQMEAVAGHPIFKVLKLVDDSSWTPVSLAAAIG